MPSGLATECFAVSARGAALLFCVVLTSCGEDRAAVPANPDPVDAASPIDAAVEYVPTLCEHPAGVSRAPDTIDDAVALSNALVEVNQQPIGVACFVESLARPLHVVAVQSVVSLQPAQGPRSPRIFLFSGNLVMSILPSGEGSDALEFGLLTTETRSIKAEIHFPLSAPLEPAEPYERILLEDANLSEERTVCSVCHGFERRVESIGFARAFESLAFRPTPRDLIPLDQVAAEYLTCDTSLEPQRCAMLTALFAPGQVYETVFPESLTTIFGE